MPAAASARVVVRSCGRGANWTEFADPLTWERLFEPVEELRGGASVIRGQAVACVCSVSVGVAWSLPSRSWIRPARIWRCTAMPTWFGRSLGHAA